MKKSKKKTKYYFSFLSGNRIKIAVITVIILLLAGLTTVVRQFKPTIETPRSEMKTLPPDIKNEMERQPVPATSSATFRVPILMYHYVEYVQDKRDRLRQLLDINPNIFEQQIQTLQQAGYTFMTAKELGEVIDGKMKLPNNPVLITFDDGHWDLDTVILPILKKYHVKATAYIIPGFLGGSDFMTPNQLRDVISSGLVDIGAHTVHHIALKGKLFPIVQFEVNQSKAILEQTYHLKVVSFAYPNGSFDQQAVNIVRDAGFTTAVSTIPGIAQSNLNRFFLYRIRPGYRTGQLLLNYLQQNTFAQY